MLRKTTFKCCQTCSSYLIGNMKFGLLLDTLGTREMCRYVMDNWWDYMRQFKEQKCFTIMEDYDAARICTKKNMRRV